MIKTMKSFFGLEKESHEELNKPGCLACGQCCEAFGGHLASSPGDIERWRRLGREDILSRVIGRGWIWVDPVTKNPEERCPFLEQTGPETKMCAIYDIRPDICRDYPTLAHGRRCLRGVFLKGCVAVFGGAVWEFDVLSTAFLML